MRDVCKMVDKLKHVCEMFDKLKASLLSVNIINSIMADDWDADWYYWNHVAKRNHAEEIPFTLENVLKFMGFLLLINMFMLLIEECCGGHVGHEDAENHAD